MQNIILLHGAIGATDQLEPLKQELSASGYVMYSFSFSGHGQTPFQNQFSISQFAEELELFIKKNNLIQPNVFGYSMGGYAALYLASQKHNLLGKIITLGTKFEWSPEIAQREIKMLDTKTIIEKVPKFAAILQNRHGNNWQLLLQKTSEMMIDLGNNNLLNQKTFSQIDNPVFIGLADNDSMVSAAETDYAGLLIKGATRFSLQNSKHPIEAINTNQLVNMIQEFLK